MSRDTHPTPSHLEQELISILFNHCGQRGQTEGAADTLRRIIRERDSALTLLRQRDSKAAKKVEAGL